MFSDGSVIISSNPLALNLSSNSPVTCFINSFILIFCIFNFIAPDDAFEASTKSSVNFFNLCDLLSSITKYSCTLGFSIFSFLINQHN